MVALLDLKNLQSDSARCYANEIESDRGQTCLAWAWSGPVAGRHFPSPAHSLTFTLSRIGLEQKKATWP
jgi:hypothetical protein